MADATKLEKNLLPPEIVEQARKTKPVFESAIGGVPLLLVRLDKTDDELAVGLGAAPTSGGVRLYPTLGFDTVVADAPSTRRGIEGGLSAPMPSSRPGLTVARLLGILTRGPCFLVPLRKRPEAGKPFEDRISVGRARNNDIVLRHESISKFHAWFECDEDDDYYVGDAQSKNGTSVNGMPVSGRREYPIDLGDQLRFGDIEATLLRPEILWDALATARATGR